MPRPRVCPHHSLSFTGKWADSDMGMSGSGYDATISYCNFSGKFKNIKKVGEFEYSMETDLIEAEGVDGAEEIRDRGLYNVDGKMSCSAGKNS